MGEVDGEPTYFRRLSLLRSQSRHRTARIAAGGARRPVPACGVRITGEQFLSQGWQPAGEDRSEEAQQPHAREVHPIDDRLPAAIAFHDVIPEALAAWYDHVITESGDGVQLASERLHAPVAVVDIGGRTTDVVVVADQAVQHGASGSLRCGTAGREAGGDRRHPQSIRHGGRERALRSRRRFNAVASGCSAKTTMSRIW